MKTATRTRHSGDTLCMVAANRIDHVRPRRLLVTGPGCGLSLGRGSTMLDDSERWLPVVGYEGYYEVSSAGRVRSVDRWISQRGMKHRFFEAQLRKLNLVKGYPHLMLKRQDGGRNFYVHTLVCEAFQGPRPAPDWEARHLNGDPLDNRLENLVWGTKKENAQDSIRHGTNRELNRTECKWGHEYTPENTYTTARGRLCVTCNRAAQIRYYEANKVEISRRTRERLEKQAAEAGRQLRKRHRTALTEIGDAA